MLGCSVGYAIQATSRPPVHSSAAAAPKAHCECIRIGAHNPNTPCPPDAAKPHPFAPLRLCVNPTAANLGHLQNYGILTLQCYGI